MARAAAKCNLCGDPIFWAKTKNKSGKSSSMPLNAEPDPTGNAWFEDGLVVIASNDRPKPRGVRAFRPHFIDCKVYVAKKKLERALKGGKAYEAVGPATTEDPTQEDEDAGAESSRDRSEEAAAAGPDAADPVRAS